MIKRRALMEPLSLLYLIGEYFQIEMIGPNWLRWYLSDFGFIFAIALTINKVIKSTKLSFTISFAAAVIFEMTLIFEIVTFTHWVGDLPDIGVFTTAYLIGLLLSD